jgi:hypothetical protein
MPQFYKTHLAFSRGCFETIFVKNTPGCLGVYVVPWSHIQCSIGLIQAIGPPLYWSTPMKA